MKGGPCLSKSNKDIFIRISQMSPDGTTPIPIPHGVVAYQSEFCGTNFGIEQGTAADGTAGTLICKYWFKPG